MLVIANEVIQFVNADKADAEAIKKSGYISELISQGIDAIPVEYENRKTTIKRRLDHLPISWTKEYLAYFTINIELAHATIHAAIMGNVFIRIFLRPFTSITVVPIIVPKSRQKLSGSDKMKAAVSSLSLIHI